MLFVLKIQIAMRVLSYSLCFYFSIIIWNFWKKFWLSFCRYRPLTDRQKKRRQENVTGKKTVKGQHCQNTSVGWLRELEPTLLVFWRLSKAPTCTNYQFCCCQHHKIEAGNTDKKYKRTFHYLSWKKYLHLHPKHFNVF